MRVLALLTDAFGAEGGIGRYNQHLMAALSQSGRISEIIVLPRFAAPSPSIPAKVRQLAPSPDRVLWSARAFAVAMRERFDLVFCGHLNAMPLAAVIARLLRAPLWAQVHGIEAWSPRGAAHRRDLASARLVTSVSRHTRKKLLTWADVAADRVRVLPNAVSSEFAPRQGRTELIAAHGLIGKRIILTVGRLSANERYKGHDRMIAVMPSILARVPDAVYLIVGSGDDQSRLKRIAWDTGVADHVVVAAQIPNALLPDYYAMADVFAMPSTGEGFGIVFLEAAASGLPVISGNCDGSVDALADGRVGRLVNPDSQEEIVAAVVDALKGCTLGSPAEVKRFSFLNFANHVDDLVRDLVR